ncbi:MAG: hypothetical protein IT433_04160 [Phycisphaerales bacterium]|nr:hypothetical protein [Phycisphaerales bacterium]
MAPRTMLHLAGLSTLLGCASCSQPRQEAADPQDHAAPGSLAYDQLIWHELLDNHAKIRRIVRHTPTTIETLTESDDPAVAAKIIDHAKAMHTRMSSGKRVRAWDPVFVDLFHNHTLVRIDLTPTEKGVKIIETSDDPATLLLMRAHSRGVSDMIRSGSAAEPTARLTAQTPLPPPEVVIGGTPHRIFLTQPDASQLEAIKAEGSDVVVNFRAPSEHPDFDEAAAAKAAGLGYCNLPYKAPDLSDDQIAAARKAIVDAEQSGHAVALHCRTGNRVGPGWVAYRVLDKGIPVEQAMNEARAMQMVAPGMESKTLGYISRHSPGTP